MRVGEYALSTTSGSSVFPYRLRRHHWPRGQPLWSHGRNRGDVEVPDAGLAVEEAASARVERRAAETAAKDASDSPRDRDNGRG